MMKFLISLSLYDHLYSLIDTFRLIVALQSNPDIRMCLERAKLRI
jgi:hypothetical protein